MTVIDSKHVTVIVLSHKGDDVLKRFDSNVPFGQAMKAYAVEIGVDPALVESTKLGVRLPLPEGGFARATYRRA